MGIFNFGKTNDTSKDIINSREYEKLASRISDISIDINSVKGNIEILRTDISNLRGKFNQRLKGFQEEDKKQEENKTETFNNDGYLPFG
jgi:tRNA threonylcarbamoyladenosine modification (KEOPS) complex  Pcc1 subunit